MTATRHPSHSFDLQSCHQKWNNFQHAATTCTGLDELAQLASQQDRARTDGLDVRTSIFTPLSRYNMPIYYPSLVAYQRSMEFLNQQQRTAPPDCAGYSSFDATVSQFDGQWHNRMYTPQISTDQEQMALPYHSFDSASTDYTSIFDEDPFQDRVASQISYESNSFMHGEDGRTLELLDTVEPCLSPYAYHHDATNEQYGTDLNQDFSYGARIPITADTTLSPLSFSQTATVDPRCVLKAVRTRLAMEQPTTHQHDRAEVAILASRASAQRQGASDTQPGADSPQLRSGTSHTPSAACQTQLFQKSRWTTAWDHILRSTAEKREIIRARKYDCRSRARLVANECAVEKNTRDDLRGVYLEQQSETEKIQGTCCLVDAMYPKNAFRSGDANGSMRMSSESTCRRAGILNAIVAQSHTHSNLWSYDGNRFKPRGSIEKPNADVDIDTSSDVLVYGMRYRPVFGVSEPVQRFNDELQDVGPLADVNMNVIGVSDENMYDVTIDEPNAGDIAVVSTIDGSGYGQGWNSRRYLSQRMGEVASLCTQAEGYGVPQNGPAGYYSAGSRIFDRDNIGTCRFEPNTELALSSTPHYNFTTTTPYPTSVAGLQHDMVVGINDQDDWDTWMPYSRRTKFDFGHSPGL